MLFGGVYTDISESRLAMAKKLGANVAYKINTEMGSRETSQEILKLLGQRAPDVTIECSGAESSIQTGIYVCRCRC